MRADRSKWEQMRVVFGGALACAAAERPAYVDGACADDLSLLADVRLLLQAHDDAGAFLESPVVESAFTICIDDQDQGGASEDPAPPPVREGQIISHYRLEERLGAGGMGVVYLAQDLALGRPAALKILPDRFTPGLRRRLLAEADACARLQHPAIATYYDSGESDGTLFIAMEFVRGRTLRERLHDGPLPEDEAVAIAGSVLEALSHAHAAGLLHLDIKPENIMVTGERAAKLLDFGLAQMLVAAGSDALTRTRLTGQSIAGTIGYMSPEQIRNEPLDVRSDLFQVGAVLHEMLAGRPAFPGTTVAERLTGVLTKDPEPLDGPGVRADLSAVIARSLARDPSRRYPSAAALWSDLSRISAGEWSPDLPDTLAVLDLENLAGTPTDDWIGSGVAESVAMALGRTPGLTLAARDKAQRIRAACQSGTLDGVAVEVGLALGCRWVMAGSYRREGAALHLTSTLVETSTGRVVASLQLDGTLEQIFDLQDRIVAATCARLAVETESRAVSPRTTLSAYEYYARGRQLVMTRERGAYDRAQELFDEAVRIDPRYAQALAGLAQTSAMRYTFTTDPAVLETALSYARRAIEADPTLADSYIWLGYAHYRLGHPADADAAYQRCRELNPREVFGFYFGTLGESWTRHPERAIGLMQRAVEIDQHFGLGWWALGSMHLYLARYIEASACFEQCSRLNVRDAVPRVSGVEGFWAECLRRMGRLDEARDKCLAGLDLVEQSDFMYRDTNRVVCLLALGRTAADQADVEAARAAFRQAMAHIEGRPRTLAGGRLFVQALAGLARVCRDAAAYDEARAREISRHEFDFSWLWMCEEALIWVDLAAAARTLGRHEDAHGFLDRARAAGTGAQA